MTPSRMALLALLPVACTTPGPTDPAPASDADVVVGLGTSVAMGQTHLWVAATDDAGAGQLLGFADLLGSLGAGDAERAFAARAGELGPGLAVCDLNADGVQELIVGGPQVDERGGVFLLDPATGGTADEPSPLAAAPFVGDSREAGRAGWAVACGEVAPQAGDEFAFAAPDSLKRAGTVGVFASKGRGGDKLLAIQGSAAGAQLGEHAALLTGVDLDSDGMGDIAVGGSGADRVHLLFAPDIAGTVSTREMVTLQSSAREAFGHALATGDVNGDGHADLVVGAPLAYGEGGRAVVVHGPFSAEDDGNLEALKRAFDELPGVTAGDQAGFSVAVPGDVDGDGAHDIVVGAPMAPGFGPETGAAYLVLATTAIGANLDEADALLLGEVAGGRLGWAVTGGDWTGDGRAEIVVSAPWAEVADAGRGAVYVFAPDVRGVTYPDAAWGRIDAF